MDAGTQSAGQGPAVAALGFEAAEGGPEGTGSGAPGRRQRRLVGGRSRPIKVKVSDEQYEQLAAMAAAGGVSIPKLLVDGVLARDGLTVSQRQGRYATFMALRRQLAGVATNLNQIAKWANTEHQMPQDLALVLDQVQTTTASLDEAIEDLTR